MHNTKIGSIEAVLIILLSIVIHTVLSLPKTLITNTKSSVIINVIYVTFIVLLFVFFIYKLLKNFPGMDIIDISEILGGKKLKTIIGFIYIVYFTISYSIFLRNFCESLKIVYYPSTNIIHVITFFIFAICLVNNLEFNASIKTNLIVMPSVLISIFFLFFANFRNFVPQRIFPILGDGFFNTFISGIGNIFAFSGIIFLYFFPPLLKEPQHFKKIAIGSIAISAVYLLLTVSIVLFMFTFFIKNDHIMPLYTAATYIEFGSFFQRLESIFLLIWMIAFACFISIVTNFSTQIFKKITNIKDAKTMVYPIAGLMLAIALFTKNYAISKFYETNIFPILVISIVFVLGLLILVLANIKKKKSGGDKDT